MNHNRAAVSTGGAVWLGENVFVIANGWRAELALPFGQTPSAKKIQIPPDVFCTGDQTRHTQSGLLENYFTWTCGDALFVVLDSLLIRLLAKMKRLGMKINAESQRTRRNAEKTFVGNSLRNLCALCASAFFPIWQPTG